MPATTEPIPAAWHFFPHVLFYRTGFPYEWLDQLRFDQTVFTFQTLDAQATSLSELSVQLRGMFLKEVVRTRRVGPPQMLNSLSLARRAVGRARSIPDELLDTLRLGGCTSIAGTLAHLNQLLSARQETTRYARAIFGSELQERRHALRNIAADSMFQEAVFSSNPNLYPASIKSYLDQWHPGSRPSKVRRIERRLISYLQRATAKTDVASLFAPINFVRLDPDEPRTIVLEYPRDRLLVSRETFISFWAVEALAERIAHDPRVRPWLRPCLSPLCEIRDGSRAYIHLLDKEQLLDEVQARIAPLALGTITVAEIAHQLGHEISKVLIALDELEKAGIISLGIPIPSTVFHPFDALVDFVRALPESCGARGVWLAELLDFEQARRAYRNAGLEERVERFAQLERHFTGLTMLPARRRPGETYADRTVIYEDCKGTVSKFVFGSPFIHNLEQQLGSALDLCATYGWLYRAHYQRMSSQAYRALSPDGSRVPFSAFVQKLQAMGRAGQFPAKSGEMASFENSWAELVSRRTEESRAHIARLTEDDVREIVALATPPKRNAHAEVDILLSARDAASLESGDYRIIVGEVGENVPVWGSQFFFYEDRARAERDASELFSSLPEYDQLAIIVPRRPHKGLLNEAFPGTFVDAFAHTARPPGTTVPLRELYVVARGGEVALTTVDGQYLSFFHHHDELVHLWTFAPPRILIPPLRPASHLPRIEVGAVVLQREQWRVPVAELVPAARDDFERFHSVWAAKQQLGLPDQVFIHVQGEIKPFCIDFTSFLSVELLAQIVQKVTDVRIVEMLPKFDQLWFEDDRGHYCTELRFLAYRT